MWRTTTKTIFPRWLHIHEHTTKYRNAKQQAEANALTVAPDEKRNQNGSTSGKQHANKHQRRYWDDPQFHFNGLCNNLLETARWIGTALFCHDVHGKLYHKVFSDEREKKCLLTSWAYSMPKSILRCNVKDNSKNNLLPNFSKHYGDKQQVQLPSEESQATGLDSGQNKADSILEDLDKVTVNSISAMENMIGMAFVQQDKSQAFQFFKGSAQLGCPSGLFNLAVCYETGSGTSINLKKAACYYEQAALKDHKLALYNFAVYTIRGLGGVTPNYEKGMELLRKAAEKDVPQAQVFLGVQYLEEENWTEAYKMFRNAAPNDVNGKYYLGLCYENGWGVAQNETVATEMYAQAAQNGHEEATLKLGQYYEHGNQGLDPDVDFSMSLYKILADKGHEGGKHALNVLTEKANAKWKLRSQKEDKTSVNKRQAGLHLSVSVPELRNNTCSILHHPKSCSTTALYPTAELNNTYHPSSTFVANVASSDIHNLDVAVKYSFNLNHIVSRTVTANS